MSNRRVGETYVDGMLGDLQLGVASSGLLAPTFINKIDTAYIVSQPSNADYTASAIDAARAAIAWFWLNLLNTTTPAGVFQILGSIDGSNYFALDLNPALVRGSGFTAFVSGTDVAYDGSAEVKLMIGIVQPPPYLKAFMDRSSGGAVGNKLNGSYFLRS
jgi:hypothetical protein